MGLILYSGFIALSVSLFMLSFGFVGIWGALLAYALIGTAVTFIEATRLAELQDQPSL